MDQKKVIEKIKKCLALAQSSNANEAAAAMRQAQALMKKYSIDADAVELSDVSGMFCKAGAARKPAKYTAMLVNTICKAFGVEAIYHTQTAFGQTEAKVEFIGVNPQPELAAYTWDVLRRQLSRDRSAYMKTLKRYKPANKTRKADLFCEGWVIEVHSQVHEFSCPEKHSALIKKYKDNTYGDNMGQVESRENKYQDRDGDAWLKGAQAGQKAQLHKAAGADKRMALTNQ